MDWNGMEWNGQSSKIMKYAFSFIYSSIALQEAILHPVTGY